MVTGQPLATIGVKLPPEIKAIFEADLKKRGTNPSVFLRQYIYAYVERIKAGEDQLPLEFDVKK